MLFSAVILAAGASTRFPGNKLVTDVSIGGVKAPLIRHTVVKFVKSRSFDIIAVVVGHEFQSIIRALEGVDAPVMYVHNARYLEGMSSSVRAGVSAVARFSNAIAIHPGDVPFIRSSTIKTLVTRAVEMLSRREDFILIPKYGVKGGHPLIISRGLVPDVLQISEECRGLKGFLRRRSSLISYVEVSDPGVLADVDSVEDLKRFSSVLSEE